MSVYDDLEKAQQQENVTLGNSLQALFEGQGINGLLLYYYFRFSNDEGDTGQRLTGFSFSDGKKAELQPASLTSFPKLADFLGTKISIQCSRMAKDAVGNYSIVTESKDETILKAAQKFIKSMGESVIDEDFMQRNGSYSTESGSDDEGGSTESTTHEGKAKYDLFSKRVQAMDSSGNVIVQRSIYPSSRYR